MRKTKSAYILFQVEETVKSRYSINIPEELKKASEEELKAWVKETMHKKDNNAEFVRRLSVESQEADIETEFSIIK